MSLSSMNSIGQSVFELESGNENVDRRMDRQMEKKQTDKMDRITPFLSFSPETKMWTNSRMDRQTDKRF